MIELAGVSEPAAVQFKISTTRQPFRRLKEPSQTKTSTGLCRFCCCGLFRLGFLLRYCLQTRSFPQCLGHLSDELRVIESVHSQTDRDRTIPDQAQAGLERGTAAIDVVYFHDKVELLNASQIGDRVLCHAGHMARAVARQGETVAAGVVRVSS